MKVICNRPKSKWHTLPVTIQRIPRESLSLILSFAQDGVRAHGNQELYGWVGELAQTIDEYINHHDTCVQKTPLVIDDYTKQPIP